MLYFDFNSFMEMFNAIFNEKIKQAEREQIKSLLQTKSSRISTIKYSSTKQLDELSEAMYDKTKSKIPNDIDGALEGKAAKAGQDFLAEISKPALRSTVKG
jgi:hypothetical protein